jgi:5-methylcytosine-specific restriction endonuclease McrA
MKGKVFCSRDCRRAFYRSPKTCPGCSRLFERSPTQPAKLYCSWDCFKRSRHVTLICVECAVPFDSYLSEARKREKRGRVPCCSRSCRNAYTSKLLGGDGTWIPKGAYPRSKRFADGRASYQRWRHVRQLYLAAVGGTCEGECGGRPAKQVHHLVPVGKGGPLFEFDNLMAVCDECHRDMHWQLDRGIFDDCIKDYLECRISQSV